MYTLKGENMEYSILETGLVKSFYNRLTACEYITAPGNIWKLIYHEGERMEAPVYSLAQKFEAVQRDNTIELIYNGLQGDERVLDIFMKLTFVMEDDKLSVTAFLENKDNKIEIIELSISAVSGISSLNGDPEGDVLTIPRDLGRYIKAPYFADLGKTGFIYRSHEQFHRDLNLLYPGDASMQWYDLNNENEGIYVGSHDPSMQITNLHVERDVKLNVLRLCINKYVMINCGETWGCAPVVYAAHKGDWHAGSKIYRKWIEGCRVWKAPERVPWVQHSRGWLRVILKQQYGEINFKYEKLPELYDEAQAAGFDTLFLIGWERGGFCRMRPDYIADVRLGGVDELKKSISIIRAKGGHVVFYISYFAVDYETDFYKTGGAKDILYKSIWNKELIFGETHAGEGTMRKYANAPKPQYGACEDTPLWQEKLKEFADIVLGFGADAVMYDIGAIGPYFCFADNHPHKKPYTNMCSKAEHYNQLKANIRTKNPNNAIMMEHNVDIFAQNIDIAEGSSTYPTSDQEFGMYRYTFPELVMTNRECGHDEEHYRTKANYSLMYGLRFDMSVYRCNGRLSDIPDYTKYLMELIELINKYEDYLYCGKFIENDGFTVDNKLIRAKAYQRGDGSIAVLAWNTSVSKETSFNLDAVNLDAVKLDAVNPDTVNVDAANVDTVPPCGVAVSPYVVEGSNIGLQNKKPFVEKHIHASLAPDSVGVYIIR